MTPSSDGEGKLEAPVIQLMVYKCHLFPQRVVHNKHLLDTYSLTRSGDTGIKITHPNTPSRKR